MAMGCMLKSAHNVALSAIQTNSPHVMIPSINETGAGTRRAQAMPPNSETHITMLAHTQILIALERSRNSLPNANTEIINSPLKKNPLKCRR
jgi:hypothetical protein